ncbi:MAG: S1 RNA-binding domain-containing protein, partial [Chloroflexota bacterium]
MVANTETSKTEPNPAEMNEFEALLEQYDYDSPFRGQILSGVVISADDHEIMLDVGLKRDAFVPRTDLDRLDDDFLSTLRPGTEVRAYVMQPLNNDEELIVSINKGLELEDWEEAKRITDEDGIVKVTIVGTNRGGLLARFKRLTGFIPMSQITSIARFSSDYEMNQAKNDLVDDRLDVKIIEVDRLRNRLIFSERAAQSQLQRVAMNKLEVGQDVHGRVVGLVDFGAFVDIGGVDGLIHISKLDHRFVDHPGEILAIGDEVYVRIESIDEQNERISLNRKVLLPDPWQDLEFEEGQLVTVTVTNIVDFGVFVSMPNGLQGLIHVSNMQTLDTTNLRNVIREGDELLSKVITIDAERQRIGLSVDDVTVEEQEAWMFNRREDTDE